MERKTELKSAADCVHCGICRNNCAFLSKYSIDIGDEDRLRDLAYHCFLCGKCTEVCPIHIDGRQTVLDMRRDRAGSDESAQLEKTYKAVLGEKRNYRFRSWKRATEGAVFFPGCNFPSLFPKTSAEASRIFARHGIGTVYECCGKPVAELGFKEDEDRILEEIRVRLRDNKIEEIVTACPNCRDFFADRLGVRVTGVYAKLKELGEGRELSPASAAGGAAEGSGAGTEWKIFLPCPDRQGEVWISEIKEFIRGDISFVEGVQCCGLGGSASQLEEETAKGFTSGLKAQEPGQVYTYCASCTGSFKRNGFKSINHILPLILGTRETPDTGKSYLNRMLTKFR